MHELSLVYQIVKTVDCVKREHSLKDIKTIRLEIGEMSDVVPLYITQAWQSMKDSTDYPDAEMDIQVIPAVAKCKKCSHTDYVRNLDFECPKCGSTDFEIIHGREFDIKEIVAK